MSEASPELSIIVVTRKRSEDLPMWEALSEDELAKCEVIIRNDPGICKARNEGIREAESDNIAFIDDDAIPVDGYVTEAIDLLREYPVIAGKVVDTGHSWVSQTVRHYDQGDEIKPTKEVVGCNMAFRKSVFEVVDGFDESIAWGHDERELIDRVREDFEVVYSPDLIVYHPYSTSIHGYLKKRYRLGVADIYYWDKRGRSILWNVFKSIVWPTTYMDTSVRGTAVKLPTGFAKGWGQIIGYLRYRRSGDVFG